MASHVENPSAVNTTRADDDPHRLDASDAQRHGRSADNRRGCRRRGRAALCRELPLVVDYIGRLLRVLTVLQLVLVGPLGTAGADHVKHEHGPVDIFSTHHPNHRHIRSVHR